MLVAVVCLSLGACSWIPKGETGLDVGIKDRGIASWYGEQFHGRQAANGEIFDMSALTAAHRTLPLGSMVRVVNLVNGKHVRVRINDRGPYVNGRILDLSYAAAARLDMVHGGISVIQLEVIGDHRPDFMRFEDESPARTFSLLRIHQLDTRTLASAGWPSLAGFDSTMTPAHRQSPNDVLRQRRLRGGPSLLATDPSNRNVAALMLS
jgi:rare lipoprotein A